MLSTKHVIPQTDSLPQF